MNIEDIEKWKAWLESHTDENGNKYMYHFVVPSPPPEKWVLCEEFSKLKYCAGTWYFLPEKKHLYFLNSKNKV